MKYIYRASGFGFRSLFGVIVMCAIAAGQSRDQNFPTSVTSSEISGAIKARDVGDSRLTSFYYAFDGTQGDIFVSVVTKNFSGDIDIFTRDALRPLTKVVIYPESGANETGRLIYLRKDENLLLRIQGRTPNDDAATFRIKFGGSFVALRAREGEEGPVLEAENDRSGSLVNSVGTIIESRTKSEPIKEIPLVVEKISEVKKEADNNSSGKVPDTVGIKPGKKPEVVIGSAIKEPLKKAEKAPEKQVEVGARNVSGKDKKPDALANIRLIILMKDGTRIERPMNQVSRFSVDNGVLTVVSKKNGAIVKYSILDVERVTIE